MEVCFLFEGWLYTAPWIQGQKIVLPDKTILDVTSWSETAPPRPSSFHASEYSWR